MTRLERLTLAAMPGDGVFNHPPAIASRRAEFWGANTEPFAAKGLSLPRSDSPHHPRRNVG
ncbi:hypothetical protein [Serratia aquatilis]|uniref:Uncharacterized protein n=1 Tax=Serratia aquatilis TaxID=1737515 RepID=A0ABV6E7V5_9GAMM